MNNNQKDIFEYNAKAFCRNIGLLHLDEQEAIASKKVAIAGMGGVGGIHLVTLLRTGFAHFHLSDMDTFELANMNRQYGAKAHTLGKEKVKVMKEEALSINPNAQISLFEQGITPNNVDRFLEGVDIVIDGMDAFNIHIRRLIFNCALEKNIPVITAGPIGFSTALIVFMPEKMGFDEYFGIEDHMDEDEQLMHFFVGLTPRFTHLKYVTLDQDVIKTKSGPSLGLACQMCAAAATTEALRILLNRPGIKAAPYFFQYDLLRRKFVKGYMPFGAKNPIQKLKLFIGKKRLKGIKTRIREKSPDIIPERISDTPIPEIVMNYLLRAGQQAPSGDNIQPWKLKAHKETIHIVLDQDVDRSLYNVDQIASMIACGAVAENIVSAATRFGLRSNITCDFDSDEQHASVAIELIPDTGIVADPRAKFIWERETNRTSYSGKPIPKEVLHELHRICDTRGAKLQLFTDGIDIGRIAGMVERADILRVENQSLHKLLMSCIRFSDDEALATRDGFHIRNLEAGKGGEIYLKWTKSWERAERLNQLGMSKAIAKVASKGMKEASAIGMISILGKDKKAFFEGGRALQSVWLETTRRGISFQPMTVLAFFRMNWRLGKQESFSAEHQKLLEEIWPEYDEMFGADEAYSDIMLFRLGYGKAMKTGTLRRRNA